MSPEVLAVIHARGGSRRIPLKNLALVGGQPLLAYPIKLCQGCPRVSRIIVSTDHDRIMDAARRHGAEVPFRRPADISEDVPSELVTLHALDHLREHEGYAPEMVLTLTPATPFTKPSTLEAAFDLLAEHPAWDAVTVVRKAQEYPEWMLRRDDKTGEISTLLGNPLDGEYNVSQNLPRCYYPAGAFWLNRVERFLAKPSLYGERWGAVVRDPEEGLDIDWPEDLAKAEEKARQG